MSREIPIVVRTDSGWLRMPSLFTIAALLAMAFTTFMAFNWFNDNVFSLGIHDGETTVVNQAVLLEKVRAEYVDGDKVSYQDLMYGALKGMISTLDPHSEFMEPVKFTEMKNDTEGGYGGVGLVIGLKTNAITVVEPMDDSPGLRAGILPGDRIVKIDGKVTERMTTDDAKLRLRGAPDGTSRTARSARCRATRAAASSSPTTRSTPSSSTGSRR